MVVFRLGTEVTARLLDRATFRGDAAFLPAAYLLNEDSDFLRSDLQDFTSERFGVFGNVSYRFRTFFDLTQ